MQAWEAQQHAQLLQPLDQAEQEPQEAVSATPLQSRYADHALYAPALQLLGIELHACKLQRLLLSNPEADMQETQSLAPEHCHQMSNVCRAGPALEA